MRDDVPSPDQLANSPELAALDVLSQALDAAEHALLAAHPILMTDEQPDDRDDAVHLAARILGIAIVLVEDLERYRESTRIQRARAM